MKFILIMTLYSGNMGGYAFIETVTFTDATTCAAAAKQWESSLEKWIKRSAICVRG